jgi:hypothetical protein
MGGRQLRLRRCRQEVHRLQELDKDRLLLHHEFVVAGHLEKPSRAIAARDSGKDAGLFARAGICAGQFIEARWLAEDLDWLGEFGQFRLRHARQADLTAPPVDVVQVAPGQTGQRDDAYIRLLAVLAGNAERGRPHLTRG